jgi:hypothetical protein
MLPSRDDAVSMVDREVTGGLPDVDAMVAVRCMPEDAFVFLIKGVHGTPGECDPRMQVAAMRGQFYVLPSPARRAVLASANGVPGCEPKVGMLRCVFSPLQGAGRDVLVRETETPTQIVRELFLEEIAALASTARITQYVGIIASRRVRLRLRANHHRRRRAPIDVLRQRFPSRRCSSSCYCV